MKGSRTPRFHFKRPSALTFVIAGVACVVAFAVSFSVSYFLDLEKSAEKGDFADIAVSGDFGAPVVVTMPENFQEPTSLQSRTLFEGDGDEITEGATVLVRTSSFESRTGAIISAYGEGALYLANADENGLADFAPFVIGQKQGARLLVARPDEIDGKPASEIIVMDILYTNVHGDPKDSSEYANDVIPSVTYSDSGAPIIHVTGKRVDKLTVVTLIPGSGGQIDKDQKIAMQYVITDGAGNVIDSTWETGSPVLVNLQEPMEGLKEGLEDQKVGSRVLVVIPSALAAGDGDRIVVVDILAAETKSGEEKK